METTQLHTPTASCGSCKANISEAFEDVAGVESAVLDLGTKQTAVTFDPARVDRHQIVQTLTDAGYAPA